MKCNDGTEAVTITIRSAGKKGSVSVLLKEEMRTAVSPRLLDGRNLEWNCQYYTELRTTKDARLREWCRRTACDYSPKI